MTTNQPLAELKDELHISHSQIFTYLTCSLKYRYTYVEQRPMERASIALAFGKSIHAAQELFYRSFKEKGVVEPLEVMQTAFEQRLISQLDKIKVPILYKKETPDLASTIAMGKGLLKTLHEEIDRTGVEVVAIEAPMSATLFNVDGEPTDMKLVGVLDLVIKDQTGQIIAVDNKTAAKSYTQDFVDDDNQLTCYAYLLAANRLVAPTADVHGRMDVLIKTKTPKLKHYPTIRTAHHRRRFAKLAGAVLAGIDARIFVPCKTWLCSDCQYATACEAW